MLIDSISTPVHPHSVVRGPLRPIGWETPVRPKLPSQQNDRAQHHSKVDVVTASLLLIMCAPVLLIMIALVKFTSRGQVFFVQDRLGLHGQTFRLFKFRSMYVDADRRLEQILDSDSKLKLEYDTFHKLRSDPRVTPIGRILRRNSLDELPQLLNVVFGDINLVGPRAYLPGEVVKMNGYQDTILSRKPGITGLWQVSGRNRLPFQNRVRLDSHYVQNRTVKMDMIILAKTIQIVIEGDGAC